MAAINLAYYKIIYVCSRKLHNIMLKLERNILIRYFQNNEDSSTLQSNHMINPWNLTQTMKDHNIANSNSEQKNNI